MGVSRPRPRTDLRCPRTLFPKVGSENRAPVESSPSWSGVIYESTRGRYLEAARLCRELGAEDMATEIMSRSGQGAGFMRFIAEANLRRSLSETI